MEALGVVRLPCVSLISKTIGFLLFIQSSVSSTDSEPSLTCFTGYGNDLIPKQCVEPLPQPQAFSGRFGRSASETHLENGRPTTSRPLPSDGHLSTRGSTSARAETSSPPTASTVVFGNVTLHVTQLPSNTTVVTSGILSSTEPIAPVKQSSTLPPVVSPPCFVFAPDDSSTHSLQFGCDYKALCKGVENETFIITNVTHGGRQGRVFCCKSSSCNSPNSFPQDFNTTFKLPVVASCITSSSSHNGTTFITKIASSLCSPRAASGCFNITRNNGSAVEYGCDWQTESWCSRNNVTKEGCHQVNLPNGEVVRLCCCFNADCNRHQIESTSFLLTTTSISPDVNSTQSSLGRLKDMVQEHMIICVLLGLGVVLIVIGVVVVVVIHRRRKRRVTGVTLVSDLRYQRLTANFSSGDTEDVQMLLGENDA